MHSSLANGTAVIATDRARLWVLAFMSLGGLLLFLWLDLRRPTASPAFGPLQQGLALLVHVAFWGAFCSLFFVQALRWRRIQARRQLAAREGWHAGVPLASLQPTPTSEALTLPCIITLEPRWFRCLAFVGLQGAVVFLVVSISFWQNPDLQASWLQLSLFFVLLTSALCWRLFLAQRLEVYADGLLVRHPLFDWLGAGWQTGRHAIHWTEARLFAIRGGQPGPPATRYELSSPSAVVTFGRVRRNSWWVLYRPVIPFEEYTAQMDALLTFICAHTGLPLADVR